MWPFEIIGQFLSHGGVWFVVPILIYVSRRISGENRSRHHYRDPRQMQNPYYQQQQQIQPPSQYQNYAPPPTPLPPNAPNPYNPYNPYNVPNGYNNYPVQNPAPGYRVPVAPTPNANGWNTPTTGSQPAWPEPVAPEGRYIPANPGVVTDPNLPTKDIFVWGRHITGWIYAGKLTVAKTLSSTEIQRYAEGKFGPDLRDKLCIEADNFEQARYIFEQSRMI